MITHGLEYLIGPGWLQLIVVVALLRVAFKSYDYLVARYLNGGPRRDEAADSFNSTVIVFCGIILALWGIGFVFASPPGLK